jgi:3'-phosphoadenosine 5'-phosphosulfate sulfotransferase (PAPS reductase)/FAD synthetase
MQKDKGHIVQGELHENGGEKYEIDNSGQIVELEEGEAVIIPEAFDVMCFSDSFCKKPAMYKMTGTIKQIASAINQLGGGNNFASGAKVWKNGRQIKQPKLTAVNSRRNPSSIKSGSIIINRTNMNNPEVMTFEGTAYEIASQINSYGGHGVKLDEEPHCDACETSEKMETGGSVEYTEEQLEERSRKKKVQIMKLSDQIKKIRKKVNEDLKSDDERTFLKSLIVYVMLKTAERVGNKESAENGHHGITNLKKTHVRTNGNQVIFTYTGKSGVDHQKSINDARLSEYIKKAKSISKKKDLFATSDGQTISRDSINNYLKDFDVTAKDIRGFSANDWINYLLKRLSPAKDEKDRKKQLNDVLSTVAEQVGHGKTTLKNHYMIPEIEFNWIEKGQTIDLSDFKMIGGNVMKEGGKATTKKEEENSDRNFTEDEKDEIYKEWKSLVNMTLKELRDFYDSDEGKEAGLSKKTADKLGISYGRESARWIMNMKQTPEHEWTPKYWEWAKKQIGFIKRMRGNKGDLVDDKGNKTRKHTSLLIWGHDPTKYKSGGSIDSDQELKDWFDKNKEYKDLAYVNQQKATDILQLIDLVEHYNRTGKSELVKKYQDKIYDKYGFSYSPADYTKEHNLLLESAGTYGATTDKGVKIEMYLHTLPNVGSNHAQINVNIRAKIVASVSFSIDLKAKEIIIGGAFVDPDYKRKGIYSSVIQLIYSIVNDQDMKFKPMGRSDQAKAFWESYDPDKELQKFKAGGSVPEKRYQAQIDTYLTASDDDEAKARAEKIAKDLDPTAQLTGLWESRFGTLYTRKILKGGGDVTLDKKQIQELGKTVDTEVKAIRKFRVFYEMKSMKQKASRFKDTMDISTMIHRADQVDPITAEKQRLLMLRWAEDPEVKFIIAFSGGKDSVAMFLYIHFELGIPVDKIELWHHDVDGHGEDLWDWKCTPSYCKAFAEWFGVKLLFSYRAGGITREMYRNNEGQQDVYFQTEMDGKFHIAKSEVPKEGEGKTKEMFPSKSKDLSTRWCSAVAKIDVMKRAINNHDDFKNMKAIICTGERRLESANRAEYLEIEPYNFTIVDAHNIERQIIQWRPVIDFTEEEIWDLYKIYSVQPHPAYELAWGRCSCQLCIFSSPNHWATNYEISPKKVNRIAEIEKEFGATLDNKAIRITSMSDLGVPVYMMSKKIPVKEAVNMVNRCVTHEALNHWVQDNRKTVQKAIEAQRESIENKEVLVGDNPLPPYEVRTEKKVIGMKDGKPIYEMADIFKAQVDLGESFVNMADPETKFWVDQALNEFTAPMYKANWTLPAGAFKGDDCGAN